MRPLVGLVFDGQSLVYSPATGQALAGRINDALPPHYSFTAAISGTTYATRTADMAARSFWQFHNAQHAVLIDIGGTSDLLAGLTAAQVLTAMENYATAALAAGAGQVIASTVPPVSLTGWGWTSGMETQRAALNSLILASSVFDAVADIAAVPESADPDNATYYSDGLHPTAALADLWVPEYTGALAGILE